MPRKKSYYDEDLYYNNGFKPKNMLAKISLNVIIAIVILVVGFLAGFYLGSEYGDQILQKTDSKKVIQTSYRLCTEEVNCYLSNCSQKAIEFCSKQ